MSQHHILVIDDDERLRDLLRRFLEESGFRVTDAGNASQARQKRDQSLHSRGSNYSVKQTIFLSDPFVQLV